MAQIMAQTVKRPIDSPMTPIKGDKLTKKEGAAGNNAMSAGKDKKQASDLKEILDAIKDMKVTVEELRVGQAVMKTEVKELKEGQAAIKQSFQSRIDSLRSDMMKELDTKFKKLEG